MRGAAVPLPVRPRLQAQAANLHALHGPRVDIRRGVAVRGASLGAPAPPEHDDGDPELPSGTPVRDGRRAAGEGDVRVLRAVRDAAALGHGRGRGRGVRTPVPAGVPPAVGRRRRVREGFRIR